MDNNDYFANNFLRQLRGLGPAIFICIGFASTSSFAAPAQSSSNDLTDTIDTSYLYSNFGLATYKSLLMASNDTATSLTYGFGLNAGVNRTFGAEYRVESESVAFKLTSSSMSTTWTSMIFKYRLWAFEIGPVIGRAQVKGSQNGSEIVDATGSGYGGYFGMIIPIGKGTVIYLNGMSVSNSDTVERQARSVTLGSRLDTELGTKIPITKKSLKGVMGYRMRSYSLTDSGTSYKESQSTTFLGFALGTDF